MKQPRLPPVAEITLAYRNAVLPSARPYIHTSQCAYDIFIHAWNTNTIELYEECKFLVLNRASRVLGICTLCTGGLTKITIEPRLIFAAALKANATAVILAHNHPSGNVMPSDQDRALTQLIAEAGRLLDILLMDHLIITTETFYSFRDHGIL